MKFRHLPIVFSWLLASFSQADTLTLGSANATAGVTLNLPISFGNTNEIVAMQFDLKFPPSQLEVAGAITTPAAPDHVAESREVSAGTQRIVVYSSGNHLLPSDVVLKVPLTIKAGAPQGGPSLTISGVILTDKLGQTFTPAINRNALDAWREANFTEAERADPAIIGDDSDPDSDGLGNLFEFLTGGNPKVNDSEHAPRSSSDVSAGVPGEPHYLKMIFRKGKNVVGATLTVETSANMTDWSAPEILLTPTGVDDSSSVEYEAAVVTDGLNRLFLRLTGIRSTGP